MMVPVKAFVAYMNILLTFIELSHWRVKSVQTI